MSRMTVLLVGKSSTCLMRDVPTLWRSKLSSKTPPARSRPTQPTTSASTPCRARSMATLAAQPPALAGIPCRTVSSPSAGHAARGPQKVSWTRRPAHPTRGEVLARLIGSSSFAAASENLYALEHGIADDPASDHHEVVAGRATDDGVRVA